MCCGGVRGKGGEERRGREEKVEQIRRRKTAQGRVRKVEQEKLDEEWQGSRKRGRQGREEERQGWVEARAEGATVKGVTVQRIIGFSEPPPVHVILFVVVIFMKLIMYWW